MEKKEEEMMEEVSAKDGAERKEKLPTVEELEEKFSKSRFVTKIVGCRIVEAAPGHSIVKIDVNEDHHNAVGQVMGGVIFTLADYAFAVATNIYDLGTVTVAATVNFYERAIGDRIFAEANVVKKGKKLSFCEVKVTDENGRELAALTLTGYHVEGLY